MALVAVTTVLTVGSAPFSDPVHAAPRAAEPAVSAPRLADSVTDRKKDLEKQLDDVRESLEGTSDQLVEAAVTLKRSQVDLVQARATLATATRAAADARARDAEIASQLAFALAAEDKASRELGASRSAEAQTRSAIGLIARTTYLSSGVDGLSIALSAQTPEDFSDRLSVATTALRVQNGALDRLDVQQAEGRARQTRLDAVAAQVDELKSQSEKVVSQRQAAQEQADAATDEVAGLVARQSAALSTIQARKNDEQARVDALQAEQDKLAAILRERARRAARPSGGGSAGSGSNKGSGSGSGSNGGSQGGGASGGGVLSYPLNAPITSSFGMRFHPILHYWRLHAGTDFGAACGTPVRAAASGVIVRAGWAGGYGNQVVVDHGEIKGADLATSYNHLSRIVVSRGAVQRGQVIAYSGTTGSSTGCHLHFEVYKNGDHVNPMSWL